MTAPSNADLGARLPTTEELGIDAELWNALSHRVIHRTAGAPCGMPLFSSRDKAVRIAVMALDAAVDEWRARYETWRPPPPDDGSLARP